MNINLYEKSANYNLRESGITFSLIALAYFFANIICAIVLFLNGNEQNAVTTTVNTIIIYGLFFAVAVIAVKGKGCNVTRFYKPINYKYLAITLIATFSLMFGFERVNEYIIEFFAMIGVNVKTPSIEMENGLQLGICILTVAVIPAVIEEFLFRGVIQSGINRGNVFIKCGLCAVLFMLFHGNMAKSGYQLLAGFTLSLMAVRSATLLWCTLAHFLNNLFILLSTYFNFGEQIFKSKAVTVVSVLLFVSCILYALADNKEDQAFTGGSKRGYKNFFITAIFGILMYIGIIILNAVA